jgi:hypothetical protein
MYQIIPERKAKGFSYVTTDLVMLVKVAMLKRAIDNIKTNVNFQLCYTDYCAKWPPPFCMHKLSFEKKICCLSDNLIISSYA